MDRRNVRATGRRSFLSGGFAFATPMYYFGFSAQLKAVIDRFYALAGRRLHAARPRDPEADGRGARAAGAVNGKW